MSSKKKKKNKLKPNTKLPDRNPVGRPTVMTPEIVSKLELGFMAGMNKTEACEFANISRNSLYDFISANPEFSNRIEELQSHPSAKAKLNITQRIEKGDVEVSQWYLERKNRDEFSLKQHVDSTVSIKRLEDVL